MMFNQLSAIALSLTTIATFAAQQEKMPSIFAGSVAQKLQEESKVPANTAITKVVAQARQKVALNSSCIECVHLAQTNLLVKKPTLLGALNSLDLLKKFSKENFEKAVVRFQEESSVLKLSKDDIKKACELWRHKPRMHCAHHRQTRKKNLKS